MITAEQKEVLTLLYGDNIMLLGDIVLAYNNESSRFKLVNKAGELVLEEDVYWIARVLGRGGFSYIAITNKEHFMDGKRCTYENYKVGESKYGYGSKYKAVYTEYTYKIFNSNFEYTGVGKTRGINGIAGDFVTVNINNSLHTFMILANEPILQEVTSERW